MLNFRTNKSSWFWRIWVSGMVAFLAFAFLKVGMQSSLVLWLILSIVNFIAVSDLRMEKTMDFLFSEKFITCLMCVTTAGIVSMAITLPIIVIFYEAAPNTPVSTIGASIFFGYLGLMFLVKYLKKDYTKLCLKAYGEKNV